MKNRRHKPSYRKEMVMMWWKLAFACTLTAFSKKNLLIYSSIIVNSESLSNFQQATMSTFWNCKTEKSTRREVEEKQRKLIELIFTLPGKSEKCIQQKENFSSTTHSEFSRAFVLAKFIFYRCCDAFLLHTTSWKIFNCTFCMQLTKLISFI